MAKLIQFIPTNMGSLKKESVKKQSVNEELEDMDVTLPPQVDRFLGKLVDQIKGYNLPKKKEQVIVARIIDALGMDRQQLMMAIAKIKKAGVLKK
jgi:hypothetical protein